MSLALDAVSVRLAARPPLFAPLTLSIRPGEIAVVMGPSGAGKSTLLDAIGGHLSSAFTLSGDIRLHGRRLNDVPAEQRRVGLLFQDAVLFPHLSVGENLAFGLGEHVRGRAARQAAVNGALAHAGLDGLGERDPATLSGGQRARVTLMRTLLAEPLALLIDEPFASLDVALRHEMRAFTFGHIRARGIPALLVTHDADDARDAGGPIIALSPSPA